MLRLHTCILLTKLNPLPLVLKNVPVPRFSPVECLNRRLLLKILSAVPVVVAAIGPLVAANRRVGVLSDLTTLPCLIMVSKGRLDVSDPLIDTRLGLTLLKPRTDYYPLAWFTFRPTLLIVNKTLRVPVKLQIPPTKVGGAP